MKPNVIVFFTDQQRWDCSGLHGNPLDLMPNFDRMAQRGTHLSRMFTCQPVCGPARSCLQTGQYATTTGCYTNGIPLRRDSRTLAHYFKSAGYTTGYIGKWHLAENTIVPEEERGGYEFWLGSNVLEFTSNYYDCVLHDNDGQPVKMPGYRVDGQTDAAIQYINRHQNDPFFLFISYLEPHHQNHLDDYPPPDGYRERYANRWVPPDLAALSGSTQQHLGGYYGMVKRLDEALGRLMDALKSLDMQDNTIILFTSDHGCHFKTRNSEYKRSCHESSIRVPTAIMGPGFNGGGTVDHLVSLVDLPPTLLDGAGIPVPEEMQGRSITPLLDSRRSHEADWPEEIFVQISEAENGRAVRTQRWKYSVSAPSDENGKFPQDWSPVYEEAFLYDLEADPYELTNLIRMNSHAEVRSIMRERLLRRMREAGEREPEIRPHAEPTGGFQRVVTQAEARS